MRIIQTFQNPVLSLWQSAIRKVGKSEDFHDPSDLRMRHFITLAYHFSHGKQLPETDPSGNVIDNCARLIVELAFAEILGDYKRVSKLMGEFKNSACDPGWLEVYREYMKFKDEKGTIPYIRYRHLDDFMIRIPNTLTIGFIADWGTGEDDARWLLKQLMRHKPDLIIHLGDIYYAGTSDEVHTHFLKIIKEVAGNTPIFTLSGNHDMYSGGKGYYSLIKQLHQPASYFCLRNDYWQFLAMDTGLNDCDPLKSWSNVTYLDPGEVEWHLDKFRTAGIRKTVLLSHHPLFSALGVGEDPQGQQLAFNIHLQGTFRHVLDKVSLWLWGHEHNLIVFDPYINLKKGRCIGASAVPMMVNQKPYTPDSNLYLQGQNDSPVMNLNKARLHVNNQGFYYHSYAIMSMVNRDAVIGYYQVDSVQQGQSRLLYCENIH